MKQSKLYQAVYADEDMEIFDSFGDDNDVLSEAKFHESEHGILFNLFELNENYEEIRTIY